MGTIRRRVVNRKCEKYLGTVIIPDTSPHVQGIPQKVVENAEQK